MSIPAYVMPHWLICCSVYSFLFRWYAPEVIIFKVVWEIIWAKNSPFPFCLQQLTSTFSSRDGCHSRLFLYSKNKAPAGLKRKMGPHKHEQEEASGWEVLQHVRAWFLRAFECESGAGSVWIGSAAAVAADQVKQHESEDLSCCRDMRLSLCSW